MEYALKLTFLFHLRKLFIKEKIVLSVCPRDLMVQLDNFSKVVNTLHMLELYMVFHNLKVIFHLQTSVPSVDNLLPLWSFRSTLTWHYCRLNSIKQSKKKKSLLNSNGNLVFISQSFSILYWLLFSLITCNAAEVDTNKSSVFRGLEESHFLFWQFSVQIFHCRGRTIFMGVSGVITWRTCTFL